MSLACLSRACAVVPFVPSFVRGIKFGKHNRDGTAGLPMRNSPGYARAIQPTQPPADRGVKRREAVQMAQNFLRYNREKMIHVQFHTARR